jgi:hypothetical protein
MAYLGTKPANSPLTSELIPDGLINTSDLADNSITTAKIAAGAVIPADLSTGAPSWDTSGNVGIGTNSPGLSKLAISGSSLTSYVGVTMTDTSTSKAYNIQSNNNSLTFADVSTTYAERMRIDTSGNLLIGKPDTGASVGGIVLEKYTAGETAGKISIMNRIGTGQYIVVGINASGSAVGGIITTSTTTSFPTSSDYRLKENIAPMIGALAKVSALKPVTYTWKSTGEASQGFIAHELAEVVPDCVTGEKDAVDAEGNPQYQGIDTSFLVATLTAAIQEQQAIITELKTRIEALEQA